ncbi:MAG: Slp/YeaY family lipoprotein [Deltaproteobacteria bacterium]|nr:Slp/YeaY family lipoprotein [Deltaproteobacteria bacterium]
MGTRWTLSEALKGIWIRIGTLMVMASALLWSGGCSVISKEVLKEVNRDITFAELTKDPLLYLGQTVLLGGVVVKVTYGQDGTLLEMYQAELDWEERPIHLDVSKGRFLALYDGFLDSEIYAKGRRITVAGIVDGVKIMKLGGIDYHYPYLLVRDIHLWKKEKREFRDPYLWYPWGMWSPWGMWGPWGPWYYPYGW